MNGFFCKDLKKSCMFVLLFTCVFSSAVLLSACSGDAASKRNINYKREMAKLVGELNAYAKSQNPNFQLLGNNPSGLFMASSNYNKNDVQTLAKDMEGVLLEAFFFGWQMEANAETPQKEQDRILQELSYAREIGTPIVNVDYTNAARKIVLSEQLNKKAGFIGFAATTYGLNRIPLYPVKLPGENKNDVTSLKQVKNFLIMLDPGAYRNREEYLKSLRATNYDLIIIDMYFHDNQALTPEEVESLKIKKDGGRRLVFSYMSIGEAEDYRYYWQKSWSENPPRWMHAENPDWAGNYKVKYWIREWKDLLFGAQNSYLDLILQKGFDGAFLDIVDGWIYFEELQE